MSNSLHEIKETFVWQRAIKRSWLIRVLVPLVLLGAVGQVRGEEEPTGESIQVGEDGSSQDQEEAELTEEEVQKL